MSDIKNRNDSVTEAQAFEYVSGTLRGEERLRFEADLEQNSDLRDMVSFWEEQLMSAHNRDDALAPLPQTLQAITSRIAPATHAKPKSPSLKERFSFWRLSASLLAFSWLVAIGIFFMGDIKLGGENPLKPDYVAVLTDPNGGEELTALASLEDKKLWLKWRNYRVSGAENTLQLWARSRSDGHIRPLYVFEQATQTVALSQAKMRLIKDAADLILTEEGPGGSLTDEPSGVQLAKGICVRLSSETKS